MKYSKIKTRANNQHDWYMVWADFELLNNKNQSILRLIQGGKYE